MPIKFSIITATFNSEKTIKKNIKSILSQTYRNFEIIIIDNNSKDLTINIIKQFNIKNIRIISRKDKGLYHALNRGIKLSQGDIISFLHSDDWFDNKNVLSRVKSIFMTKKIKAVTSCIKIFYKFGFIRKFTISKNFNLNFFSKGHMPPHCGVFIKKNVVNKIGFFNTKYKIASDFDYLIRLFKFLKNKEIYHGNFYSIGMKSGGKSTKNLKNIIIQNIENLNILKDNNIKYNILTFLFCKIINRTKQFLK